MKREKLFYKELKFLEKDCNFEFLVKSKGIDERFVFKKNDFEIGYFSRASQFGLRRKYVTPSVLSYG